MQEIVFIQNGEPVTDSLTVAEVFGKEHKHVIRDIEVQLEKLKEAKEQKWGVSNFGLTQYQHPQNKQWYPKYNLTENGFAILAMSYVTPEAMRMKVKFLEEFKRMREVLSHSKEKGIEPPKAILEQDKEIFGIPKYDPQQLWKWKPNPHYLSASLNLSTKKVLLKAIGDIGAIEHEQMIELFGVQQKHIDSMISGGELIHHELWLEGRKQIVYTLGLRGSEITGNEPARVEYWTIPDLLEKLVFFEFVKYLQAGAAPYAFEIKADKSPFVGMISYSGDDYKVYVLQRPISWFEVPEDDTTALYILAAKEEYAKPLERRYGWPELYTYQTFMPVQNSRNFILLSSKNEDRFAFLNDLL